MKLYRTIEEGELYKLGLLKATIDITSDWSWEWVLVIPFWWSRKQRVFRCIVFSLTKYRDVILFGWKLHSPKGVRG